ncbi:STAS domain-containing protein [Streptomyces sp. NPDC056362]|uniref:STAS domain-containing protein n=1 Tax=unclassified Streptomyces TaxID=2593676 RepID=UPI0035D5B27A
MRIVIDQDQGPVRVLRCAGELDFETVPLLQREGERLARTSGVETLVLDVSGVTFADSSALNCFLILHRQTHLVIGGPLPVNLARLLSITGADQVLTLADDAS